MLPLPQCCCCCQGQGTLPPPQLSIPQGQTIGDTLDGINQCGGKEELLPVMPLEDKLYPPPLSLPYLQGFILFLQMLSGGE